jgi:hypothetical protein
VGFEFGWVVRLAGIEPAAFRSGAESASARSHSRFTSAIADCAKDPDSVSNSVSNSVSIPGRGTSEGNRSGDSVFKNLVDPRGFEPLTF